MFSSVIVIITLNLGSGVYHSCIFSRRFSGEKSQTITVASFFSFFFVRLQSHTDWATFLTIETTKTTTIRPSPVSGN